MGADLKALFAAEEANFASAAFVDDVARTIRRDTRKRRVVLCTSFVLAALLSGTQLPALMSAAAQAGDATSAILGDINRAVETAKAIEAPTPSPWVALSAASAAVCSLFMVFFERQ